MKQNRYSRPHKADHRKPVVIYCLWCPVAKKIRYIGKSNQPDTRVYLHIFAAKRKYHDHHASRWLRKLDALGFEPRLRVLFRVPPGDDWQDHEKRIIDAALKKGWPLTNQTIGGEGVEFLDPIAFEEAKKRRKAGITPEVRARMSASIKAAWADPEKRARIIERQKEAASTPKRRTELSAASKMRTAEGEARRLLAVEKYYSNPENRKRLSAGALRLMNNPELARSMGRMTGKSRRTS